MMVLSNLLFLHFLEKITIIYNSAFLESTFYLKNEFFSSFNMSQLL